MKKLLKIHGLTEKWEYYDMIIESMAYGKFRESGERFLILKRFDKINFIKYMLNNNCVHPLQISKFLDLL